MGDPTEEEVTKWATDFIRAMGALAVVGAVQKLMGESKDESDSLRLQPGQAVFVKHSDGPFVEIVEHHPSNPKVEEPQAESADPMVEIHDRDTKETVTMRRSELRFSDRYIDNAVDVLAAASPGDIWTLDERTVTLVFTSNKGLKFTVKLTDIDLSSKGQAQQFERKGGFIYPLRSDGSYLLDDANTPRLAFAAKHVHERIAKARIERLEAANLVFSFQIALAQLAGSVGSPNLPGFRGGTLRTPSVPRGQLGTPKGGGAAIGREPVGGGSSSPSTGGSARARTSSAGPSAPSNPPAKPTSAGGQSGAITKGADPSKPRKLFDKTTETGTTTLKAGEGRTDKFGNVEYSTLGSPKDVALARYHEAVHSALSPKFKLFRNLRADIGMAGYKNSALLKYIEEALAESYAQLKVVGIKGLPTGIKFPIKEGYVTIQRLAAEGAIGTVVVGGITYYVFYDSE
jgi:hypothetical protein